MAGRLFFTCGDREVRSVSLTDGHPLVIGRRGPGVDVTFEDFTKLSRRHCRVRAEGGRAWVEGLDNRGAIFVNDKAVGDARELKAGDVVRLVGDLDFRLEPSSDG